MKHVVCRASKNVDSKCCCSSSANLYPTAWRSSDEQIQREELQCDYTSVGHVQWLTGTLNTFMQRCFLRTTWRRVNWGIPAARQVEAGRGREASWFLPFITCYCCDEIGNGMSWIIRCTNRGHVIPHAGKVRKYAWVSYRHTNSESMLQMDSGSCWW